MAFAQIDDYFLEKLHLLTRNEIVVYCFLVKSRNDKTKKCNPKQSTIAAETNLKTSRVSEAIKGLEAKGWAILDGYGEFILPEKVTQCVTTQVTNSVRKSYGKRNEKLRNAEVEVTQSVTEIKGIENTREKTNENTREKKEAETAPPPEANLESDFEIFEDGMKARLKTPAQLPNETQWITVFDFWTANGYTTDNLLETFDLCEEIRDGTIGKYWEITPKFLKSKIGHIEQLRREAEDLLNGANNGTSIQRFENRRFPETASERREREARERRAAMREIDAILAERDKELLQSESGQNHYPN